MADQVEITQDCAGYRVGNVIDVSDSNSALVERLLERGKAKRIKGSKSDVSKPAKEADKKEVAEEKKDDKKKKIVKKSYNK